MPELEIGLVDGGELNFDQSLLQFNVKKKSYCYNNANFTIAFFSEFFKM